MSATKQILPKGWRWVKVGSLCNLVNGGAYKPSDWSTEGTKIIRIQNLNDETKSFNYWAGSLHNHVLVNDGDILLAWSGTPGTSFGTHRWWRGNAILNQHIFRVDLSVDHIAPEWFVIATNFQLHVLISRAHGGVGLRHVKRGEVENLEIPLPPLDEQKRIAAHLDEQMRYIEQARQAAEESLSAAWVLPSVYLSTIFDNSDDRHWKWVKLDDVCELLPAKTIKSIGNTTVTAITSACLTENGFSPDGLKTARMDENDAKVALVRKGEILVARSNTPDLVGRVSIYPGDPPNVVASDLTIRIWAKPSCYPPFLTAYLSYLYLSGYWKERAGGASGTMKKITRSQLLDIKVPVPDIEIQKKIVDEMQEKMGHFKQLEHSLESQLAEINELSSALLRQAFAGKI